MNLNLLEDVNIRHKIQLYTDVEESIYAGRPTLELDEAWHNLLANMTIRVTDEELTRSGQKSVSLPGGGQMAWFGLFHELHCIKTIRQLNYHEHYHPNMTNLERGHWNLHLDHCLDLLRSAAMCRADTTLTTFGWTGQDRPQVDTRIFPRRCVDWDVLMESVSARVVSRSEIGRMSPPVSI